MVGGKSTVEIIIAAKDRTKAAFASANTRMKTMRGSTGKLSGAMNGLKGGLSNVSSSLGSFGAALGPVGIAVAGAAVVMATLGGAAFKAALEFEKAFATIRTGTGATGEALEGLKNDFKAVFVAIPAEAGAVSGALAAMNTTTGASGELLQNLTTNIMEVSRMLGEDGVGNAQAFGEAMKQWQIPAEEGTILMDRIFKITQDTGIGFNELMSAMNAYGPVLKNAGFTAAEAAELFGLLEGSGIAVSRVMPGLNAAFRKWAEAEVDGKVALEEVIAEIANAETEMRALTIATETFGAEGAQRMSTAIRNGTVDLSTLGEALEGTSGLIAKTAEETLKFGDKWTLLKNNITEAIAPIGDVIMNVLGAAITGLSTAFDKLQKVGGVALDFILIKFHILRAFLEGLTAPIIAAFAPLKQSLDDLMAKFKGGIDVLQIFEDVFTIIIAAAKWLGEAIGNLLAKAITPLVDKIQNAIEMLTEFYNKLGPIKTALEWVKGAAGGVVDGIHNLAESTKDAKEPVEALKEELKELAEEGSKAPQAVAEGWALTIKSFQEGTGSYKDAIGGITKKIEELTEEWMTATDKRKKAIDREVAILKGEKDVLEEVKASAEDHFSSTIALTEDATKAMEEFSVTIGDTTIEFKGAAAEVVKNADAYKKLEDAAQTLMDLDWAIFSEFEASLPRIEAGIGDMESAFVGLKDVLENNIVELENVKQAVMDISEIAAPFLEAGFLNGIKSIGAFAGALKDAGSAINDFSSLQDVSIDGMINFGLHVNDMVSALEILESQMEDLVPAFGNMDSLIDSVADAFLYSGDKADIFTTNFETALDKAYGFLEKGEMNFAKFSKIVDEAMTAGEITFWHETETWEDWSTRAVESADDVSAAISLAARAGREFQTQRDSWNVEGWEAEFTHSAGIMRRWALDTYGVQLAYDEIYEVMKSPPEEQKKWLDDLMHSEAALTFQMDKQTNALKAQTGQLTKITDALQPYLVFMRTLNELAALSTLSTEQLNNGLNAIKDTLINLGTALSTFDLRSVMESLFGTIETAEDGVKTFTGGVTTSFTDTMFAYQTPLNALIAHVTRLSNAIIGLTSAFDALANISDSVLADQTKLTEVFEGIVDVMSNFDTAMGEGGFAQAFADGMDAMLKSAAPLTKYFQDNNAAIKLFNDTLSGFTTTISNVVDTMGMLKDMSEMILPSVDELEAGFDKAEEAVLRFDNALLKHFGIDKEARTTNMEKYANNVFTALIAFAKDWSDIDKMMGDSFETFEKATTNISGMIIGITSLAKSFKSLTDIVMPSSTEIEAAFVKIRDGIAAVTKALDSPVWAEVSTNLGTFKTKWDGISEGIAESVSSFSDVITIFANIIDATKRLSDTFTDMEEIVVITSDQMEAAFKDIPTVVDEVIKYLATKSFATLKGELKKLHTEWQKYAEEMEKSMESFNGTIDTFSTLISKVLSLSSALDELKDMSVLSVRDIDEALKNIPIFLDRFVDALALNMGAIKQALKDLDKEWAKHAEEMKATMPAYEDSTSSISKLVGSLLSLNSALTQLAEMGTISQAEFDSGFTALMESIGNFATSLSNNVDDLIISLQKLAIVWQENKGALIPLMDTFLTVTYSFWEVSNNALAMAESFDELQKNSGSLEKGFKTLIEFIEQVVKGTKEFYTAEAADELARYIDDVGKVIDAFLDLEIELKSAMDKVESAIKTAVEDIEGKILSLSSFVKSAFTWGANMMDSYIKGIKSKSEALAAAVSAQAAIVDDYLGASSPTRLGPLSHLDEWPRNLMQSYSSGIEAEMHTLNTSFASLAPGMGAGAVSGGNKSIVIHNTQYINSREDADYANKGLERILQRHAVM